MQKLLDIQSLSTDYETPSGRLRAVDDVCFHVARKEIFGIVGESGCGKSATCRSIIQLFGGARANIAEGSISFLEEEMVGASPARLRAMRGRHMAMIFQDPMTALNPTMTIGRQVREAVTAHEKMSRKAAEERALALLRSVHIPNPEMRMKAYPHELSGGLRQRVVIAIALSGEADLLIADEPTTALDVTVQDQILKLLVEARDKRGAAVLLVTHDLGVVAQTCDRVAVMYAGRIVETGTAEAVLTRPAHPYTRALLDALPQAQTGQRLVPIEGAPPNLVDPPPGCRFLPRCPIGDESCARAACALVSRHGDPAHLDACHKGGHL